MATLTLRLPDPLDRQLNAEAALRQLSRSGLARLALEKYLRDLERERRMAEIVKAARFLATNAEARAESLAIAEEFLPLDNEPWILRKAAGRATHVLKSREMFGGSDA